MTHPSPRRLVRIRVREVFLRMYRTVLITVLISNCSGNNDDARKAYFMSLVNALKYSSIVDHRILRYEQLVAYFCSG